MYNTLYNSYIWKYVYHTWNKKKLIKLGFNWWELPCINKRVHIHKAKPLVAVQNTAAAIPTQWANTGITQMFEVLQVRQEKFHSDFNTAKDSWVHALLVNTGTNNITAAWAASLIDTR